MNGCKQCPAFDNCTATYRGSACAALRWSYGVDTDPEIVNTTDREKLIELLKNAPHFEQMHQTTWQEAMAGWLINNGVTFAKDTNAPSKWIHLLDEMPQERGGICKNVILLMDDGFVTVGWLNEITRKGYYLDTINDVVIRAPLSRFTHWMPLPEPPKGGMLGE